MTSEYTNESAHINRFGRITTEHPVEFVRASELPREHEPEHEEDIGR